MTARPAGHPKVRERAPINSRRKGADFERIVAARLNAALGTTLRRNLRQYQTRDEGDLVQDPPLPFLFECKAKKVADLPGWRRQAVTAAQATGQVPIVIYRITGGPMRASVPIGFVAGDASVCRGEWCEMGVDALCELLREALAGSEAVLRAWEAAE